MIKIKDLDFGYAKNGFRLMIPELNISSNQNIAMVGHSGTGKTTLAYLISGILRPQSGHIWLLDNNLSALSDKACRNFRISNIGFVFQSFELLDYLNLQENILLPYYLNSSLNLDKSVKLRALELAEKVGLKNKTKKLPQQLSQGEKQRLAVCRALITRPKIIIGDEPTGNLDVDNTESIIDLIKNETETMRSTFIMITHNQQILNKFDQVIDIEKINRVKS